MPKTRKRLFFINPIKRAVDNTIAGAVLIDQYYRMCLVVPTLGPTPHFSPEAIRRKGVNRVDFAAVRAFQSLMAENLNGI